MARQDLPGDLREEDPHGNRDLYLDDVFDAPESLVALATLPYLVASGLVRLVGDRLTEQVGAVRLSGGALVISGLGLGVMGLVGGPLGLIVGAVLGLAVKAAFGADKDKRFSPAPAGRSCAVITYRPFVRYAPAPT